MDTRDVLFNDTMNGAGITAGAAVGALFIVNRRKVINKGDCTVGAGLRTLTARDTTVCAELTNNRAFIVA